MNLWRRAEDTLGLQGLLERLAALEGHALTALLLELASRRAARRSPAEILRQSLEDPFAAPCDLDQRRMLALDAAVVAALPPAWEAVELSPVVPLGTVSRVAVAHQNKVLATARNLEVLADPTNALALLAAARRAAGAGTVRLCTSSRVLRTPRVEKKGFTQHFRLWAFVSGGRDPGQRSFEREALREHVALHQGVLAALRAQGLAIPEPRLLLSVAEGHRAWVEEAARALPEARLSPLAGSYYQGVRFNLALPWGEGELPVSDGGLTDWLATLRSDRKERLFISAIGTELLARLYDRPASSGRSTSG